MASISEIHHVAITV